MRRIHALSVAGLTAAVLTLAAGASVAGSGNRAADAAPPYPVNANGQTYGSALAAVSPETEPDLIEAIAADGTEGYVRADDLTPPQPANPSEAARRNGAGKGRIIPLYAVDGKTVIGTFRLPPPESGTVTPQK